MKTTQSTELCRGVNITDSGLFYGVGSWTAIYDFEKKCFQKLKEKNEPKENSLIQQAQLKTLIASTAGPISGIGAGIACCSCLSNFKDMLS